MAVTCTDVVAASAPGTNVAPACASPAPPPSVASIVTAGAVGVRRASTISTAPRSGTTTRRSATV
jgi:hypothetical protein